MHLNLARLETFYWVVRLGSFAKAAAQLHTTPPSVTLRVQQLEDELGVQLIDRSGRERRATARGLEIYEQVQHVLASLDTLRAMAARPAGPGLRLRLGVVELVAMDWLPEVLAYLNRHVPAFELQVDVDLALPLVQRLEAGDLDVAIAPFRPAEPFFASRSVGFVRYAWYAPMSVPAGVRTLQDVPALPIARLTGSFPYEKTLERTLASPGRPRVVICNQFMAIRAMLLAGATLAVLPEILMREPLARGEARRLDIEPGFPDTEMFLSCADAAVAQPLGELATQIARFSTFARLSA